MIQPEGSVPMLRHLQREHGYRPKHPIQDWQERVEWVVPPAHPVSADSARLSVARPKEET